MAVNILENKVAIVTGGTRGIGKAIAERLLAEKARVAICGTRQKSVDEAVGVLSAKGDVFGMAADVRRIEEVRQFIAAVQQRFDAVHILINNAGTGSICKRCGNGARDMGGCDRCESDWRLLLLP